MTGAIALIARLCIFAGMAIMVSALITVRRLIGQLPSGVLRQRWAVMAALIAVFLVGYLGYIIAFWNRHAQMVGLIVPAIFFLGACFVWLTGLLSLQTAMDIVRVTRLEHESQTDALTGVFNRRYLDRRLPEEIAAARRYGLPLALMLLDIDHFKRINDEHGHPTGDKVLADIAALIGRELREVDVLARFGGEEFVVVTPHTTRKCVMDVAERLRGVIEAHSFPIGTDDQTRTTLRVTTSIGVASFRDEVRNMDSLIQVADRCLYQAKKEGRNRVVGPDNGA